MDKQQVQPVLKWAGGKRQLVEVIKKYMPAHFSRYYEPFVGAGAVLLDIQPKDAVINDYNKELINVYEVVRDEPEQLIKLLKIHERKHSKEYYYIIRGKDRNQNDFDRQSAVEMAARTVYLNKTCYNGLFRLNANGFFNTPIGRYTRPSIVSSDKIRNLSRYLNSVHIIIRNGDFEQSLYDVSRNDFVYLDPPYHPVSRTSTFTNYTSTGFSFEEQKRLREVCDKMTRDGVKFLESNSDTPEIRSLYKNYSIVPITARRSINPTADKGARIGELLIYNYDIALDV